MTAQRKEDYISAVDIDESLDALPSDDELAKTVEHIEQRGITVDVVETRADALDAVKDLIPDDASIMNGHSTTLEEIGLIDYLNTDDAPWENLHDEIFTIEDPDEQAAARRRALTADYFLGSVNAIAQTGELVAADASGSRVGAYPFAAKNLVLVAGTNKIVESMERAQERLEQYAYPLENERAQEAYGTGSVVGKEVIIRHELNEDRTHVVLVKENLGF